VSAPNAERCPAWSDALPTEPGFYYVELTGWFVQGTWDYGWTGVRLHVARLSPNQNGVLFIEMVGQEAEPFKFWQKHWRGEWLRIPAPAELALARATADARVAEAVEVGYRKGIEDACSVLIGRGASDDRWVIDKLRAMLDKAGS